VGADRPWDPVITRPVLPLLAGPSVDTAIITTGGETASPPGRMVSPASIKSLSVTYGLFPFQLLPPQLLEVEVEALIKGQLYQALVVVPSSIVAVALCPTNSSFLRFDEIHESLEASSIVKLAIVYIPIRSVGAEPNLRSEAVIGVGRPVEGVVFPEDGLGFSVVVPAVSDERRAVVRGIAPKMTTRGENRTRADDYQSR